MLHHPSAVLAACLALAALPSMAAAEAAQSAWVQLTGRGAEARATVPAGPCPEAVVDGRAYPMVQRKAADADFPQVCALPLPEHAAGVTVGGRTLPAPRPARRIVILGDTGCEIKGLVVQNCNDPRAWPFAIVARLAAARRPDLVIHVGDYYYRQTACPAGVAACAGNPYGDRWDTWAAEFFRPAEPLLQAAPWVFARGNHEACDRGPKGWFALLDANPPPGPCPVWTPPFVARSGGLNLLVIDSSASPDRGHKAYDTAHMRAQLDRIAPDLAHGEGWLVTHRPVWGLVPVLRVGPAEPFEVGLNFTEQEAIRGRPLDGLHMVVSGHVHHFQALDFGPARPAQLIVGTGGDSGLKADLPSPYGGMRDLDGLPAASFTFGRFGYYLMERDGADWAGAFRDIDDKVVATCRLHERELTCRAAPG